MSGLEALGALAAVLQTIDNCLQTTLSIQTRYKDVRNAPNTIAQHKYEIEQLVEIVQHMRDFAPFQTTLVMSSLADISNHAQALLEGLDRVTSKPNEGRIERNWKSLKFVYRERTIESSFKTLDRKKAALCLCVASIDARNSQTILANVNILGTKLDVVQANQLMLLNPPGTEVTFSNLPPFKTAGFVGRKSLLQVMESAVIAQEAAVATVVLVGMGGSGKTQLALKYCEKQSAGRRFIFWINAESEQSARRAFGILADDFAARSHVMTTSQDSDAKIRYTTRSISDLKSSWILVFDNYDDPASFPNLQSFMPSTTPSARGTVLVTSRHLDVARLGGSKIEVGPMDEEEGIDLLLARACLKVSTETQNHARPIVRRLGGLALALDQAGSYLQKTRIILSEFNEHFEAQKERVLNHTPLLWNYTRQRGESENESRLNVFTTWELSFQVLQRIYRRHEVEFTMLLGFFNCSSISEKLFRIHHNNHSLAPAPEDTNDLSHTVCRGATVECACFGSWTWCEGFSDQNGGWNCISFRTFLSTLHDLSLIQGFSIVEKNICLFALHPLVADWMKLRVDNCARRRFAIETAKICHSVIVSEELSSFSPNDKQDLLSHIDECLKNEESFVGHYEGVDLCSWKNLANSFADFYFTQGRYEQAAGLYQRLLEHPLRVDPIHEARINHALATVYHSLGRHHDSECLYRRVLEQREAQLGRTHRETLCTIECLANIYRSAARYSEAEDLYSEVLRERESLLGPDHLDTLQVVANLANNYRSRGRYQDAEDLYLRALSGCESKLGAHHSTTITLVNDLASNFQSQGQHSDAESLYMRALEERRKKLGDKHPDTLWTMADLANNFQSQGRYHEAEALYRDTVSLDELVYGTDHPETLWALDGLANVVRQQHRYDEAQILYQRALSGREKRLGHNHHNTLRTLKGLGLVYGEQGRYDEAEKLYERALEGLQQQLGPDHPKTLSIIHILAQNYSSKGAYAEAKGLYHNTIEGMNTRLGSDHTQTLEMARHLEALSCFLENQSHISCS